MSANPVLVELTRGGLVESFHRGAIVACDAQGRVVFSIGDANAAIYPRSAFKSLQALPLVESGAADSFRVSDEELALACASHSGEAMHVERVERWLARIECKESDLACGPHLPVHEPSAHAMIRAGQKPCRMHNNCSGKHSGFLTLARHLNVAPQGYERPDHPVQRMVRTAIAEMCDLDGDKLPVGIDGCAAPNYALPLSRFAMAMARLGNPKGLRPARAQAATRLVDAWRKYPLLMSGTGRACADMIGASAERTVVKTGAEGVFAAVLPEQGIGIALKADDGTGRASETLMAHMLVRFGVAKADDPGIAKHLSARVRNWRGDDVGERRISAALASA